MKKIKIKHLTIIPMVCLSLFALEKTNIVSESIIEQIPIKLVDSGVNEEGKQYQSFSYEVLPADTTNKEVTVAIYWAENGASEDVSNFLDFTHDEVNRIVTVILLKKANYQAVVEIENQSTGLVGSVYIDFYRDHLGWKNDNYQIAKVLDIENNEATLNFEAISQYVVEQSLGLGDGTVNKGELTVNIKSITKNDPDDYFDFYDFVDGEYVLRQEQYWCIDFYDDIVNLGKVFSAFDGTGVRDAYEDNNIFHDFLHSNNDLKRIISSYTYLSHNGSYDITFDYYDQVDVVHTVEILQLVPISSFEPYLEIFADEIHTEVGNIIF